MGVAANLECKTRRQPNSAYGPVVRRNHFSARSTHRQNQPIGQFRSNHSAMLHGVVVPEDGDSNNTSAQAHWQMKLTGSEPAPEPARMAFGAEA
jgi:hypothetical protein